MWQGALRPAESYNLGVQRVEYKTGQVRRGEDGIIGKAH
jgi:hypothetical protein